MHRCALAFLQCCECFPHPFKFDLRWRALINPHHPSPSSILYPSSGWAPAGESMVRGAGYRVPGGERFEDGPSGESIERFDDDDPQYVL